MYKFIWTIFEKKNAWSTFKIKLTDFFHIFLISMEDTIVIQNLKVLSQQSILFFNRRKRNYLHNSKYFFMLPELVSFALRVTDELIWLLSMQMHISNFKSISRSNQKTFITYNLCVFISLFLHFIEYNTFFFVN